jgi:hypothetical protein
MTGTHHWPDEPGDPAAIVIPVKVKPDGSKGNKYRPEKCTHAPNDGCEWCCERCNYDTHFCPGCGTVVGHLDIACDECRAIL